jgi:hypothetical protein
MLNRTVSVAMSVLLSGTWLLAVITGHAAKVEAARPATFQQWAVIVGIADYVELRPIDGPPVSARRMQDVLTDSGWNGSHIRLLIDRQATRSAIAEAVDWMKQNAGSNDVCLFYFCGHNRGGDGEQCICPVDSLSSGYSDIDIGESVLDGWLSGIEARKVIILDTCNAGAFADMSVPNTVVLAECELGERCWVDSYSGGYFTI